MSQHTDERPQSLAASHGVWPDSTAAVVSAPNGCGSGHQVPDAPTSMDWSSAVEGIRAALRLAGVDPNSPRVVDTPERVITALIASVDRSALEEPKTLLAKRFEAGTSEYVHAVPVLVGPISFTSLCEHHLLPFRGVAWIGYVPAEADGGYVGLSKLARLVEWHTRAMGMQERITGDILTDLQTHLSPLAGAVKLVAEHTCMTCRGAKAERAMTTTWREFGGKAGADLLAAMN